MSVDRPGTRTWTLRRAFACSLLIVTAGCATIRPADFHPDPPAVALRMPVSTAVSVSPELREDPISRFNPGGIALEMDRNEFSTELARLLSASLRTAGVPLGGEREIRVAVVYLDFMFKGPCILDYNVGLGGEPAFGMQSRGESGNFAIACRRALENAVRDIVADARTDAFLAGE